MLLGRQFLLEDFDDLKNMLILEFNELIWTTVGASAKRSVYQYFAPIAGLSALGSLHDISTD